jgi:hypothetical protein
MRRNVIIGVAVVALSSAGYVGYLLSRDPRQHHLSAGEHAVIALSAGDQMLLEDASSEDVVAMLSDGDQVAIVDDPAAESTNRMRKVSVLLESGEHKGLTGKVARIWIRPTSLLRGRADF